MSISITTMIFMKLLNWKNGMISPKNGSDTMEMIWEASFHRDGVDQVEGFKKKFKSWRNHFIENVRQKISIINWSKMQTEIKKSFKFNEKATIRWRSWSPSQLSKGPCGQWVQVWKN